MNLDSLNEGTFLLLQQFETYLSQTFSLSNEIDQVILLTALEPTNSTIALQIFLITSISGSESYLIVICPECDINNTPPKLSLESTDISCQNILTESLFQLSDDLFCDEYFNVCETTSDASDLINDVKGVCIK